MAGRTLFIIVAVITVALVAIGSVQPNSAAPTTPDGVVQRMFQEVTVRDYDDAYKFVADASKVDKDDFTSDLAGRDGSLRSYSSLQSVDTSVLHQNEDEAMVRTVLTYSSAVGALQDAKDLKVVREGNQWKVVWPVEKEPKVPPQVIPVNYLRWDVITRGANDDWGAQNVDAPKIRITTMNAVQRNDADGKPMVVILGEIVNEDTVPGFVSVNATLVGKDGSVLGEETAFDKISHTLLPKEVSPFRIDFARTKLANVKSVRMAPTSMLISASADPVIGVMDQKMTKEASGQAALAGDLVNQSGQTVNIPQVLATFYDSTGKVIWVDDGYVQNALVPQVPQPFAVAVAPDIAAKVQTYRVTVNKFIMNRLQSGD
jgi:hypothetical protein